MQGAAPAGAAFFWRLRARVGTLFLLKLLTTAGGIALFFVAYFWTMRHPLAATTVMPLTWVDRGIGFHPQAFALYASLWVYISLGTALCGRFRELALYGLASLAMSLVGFAAFMLAPTRVPDFGIDWSLYPWLEFMKRVDVAGNACPSLHAAFCVFTAPFVHVQLRALGAGRGLLAANLAWALGILGSTIATRQHVALDVLAGAALGGAAALAVLAALRNNPRP